MNAPSESQYPAARAFEDLGATPSHPVCFHAGAFSIGKLRYADRPSERAIRFRLHDGHVIDVAMSRDLAGKLAASLIEGGETNEG